MVKGRPSEGTFGPRWSLVAERRRAGKRCLNSAFWSGGRRGRRSGAREPRRSGEWCSPARRAETPESLGRPSRWSRPPALPSLPPPFHSCLERQPGPPGLGLCVLIAKGVWLLFARWKPAVNFVC